MRTMISCCIALTLLLAAGPASAQWNFEYQQELSADFDDIMFPSGTVGYAVGSGGLIWKTTDGGNTWVEQTTPVIDSFFDVFFKTENEGWAVGDNGAICYTTDGGTNWIEHPQSKIVTTADLNAVTFFGTSGWLGGDNDAIWLTIDNGATWTLAQAFGDEVEAISFASALVGVAAVDASGCWYTTDGGVTWTQGAMNLGPWSYSRTDIEEILMIDASNAVATGWGSMVGPQPTIIVRTTDGGQTWNIANTDYHWETYGYGYGLSRFADGEIVLAGGSSGSAGFVLHSTDNGVTWTSTPPVTGEGLNDVAVVPGTDRAFTIGAGGFFALSDDRATTWDVLFDPTYGFNGFQKIRSWGPMVVAVGDLGAYCDILPDGLGGWDLTWKNILVNNFAGRMHDVWVVPTADSLGTVIYACGAYGSAYKSTDNGETWIELLHTFGVTSYWYSMQWFDVDNGMLVGEVAGDDAIWVTSDGGANWTEIWYNVKSEQFNSVSFAPDNPLVGVIGGDNIALYYTTDGGANWTAATEDIVSTTADIEEVWMVDATTGWAVGDAGIVAKTTDGGVTWLQQTAFTAVVLMDVYFDNPMLGWIAGDDGTCYRTDDGGVSWVSLTAGLELGTRDANAVYFQGATGELWLGADYFDLLRRNDAAATDADPPIALPFALNQNYPNPFNPSTTISFSIAREGRVSLNVYDVSGRLVAKVLDREMQSGSHTIGFNASGLASGVYFYKLRTADQEQTRKMILLR
ncbi:MAG: YCF48-related protein [Candidatus Krumholzibacteria bacterium]|nr:YCF48-related protein [Candidatus Krumholzibacteria bacterium]